MRARGAGLLIALLFCAVEGSAQQRPTGHVSLLADYLPNHENTAELRARLFAEEKIEISPRFRVTLSGFVEGLLARRPAGPPLFPDGRRERDVRRDAIARVQDANLELRAGRAELMAGFARVAWGKLDELQPSDVVNPLDVSRFFFEGRSEARLPAALVRGRLFLTESAVLEGIYVPVFRRGDFDRLDEETSPFNVAAVLSAVATEREPDFGEAQGGARFSATAGRVDWSVSAYRGFEPFGIFRTVPPGVVAGVPLQAIERIHPRFTMVAADFETVRGEWGVRGEVAAFVEDSFQSLALAAVGGRSFDAGLGVDRRAGDYRISGTVLFHRERYDAPIDPRAPSERSRADVSLIASADRTFARERYQVRIFGVYNASESSGFARGIATAALRDNLAVEGSTGWFIGGGRDLVGRFRDSDFLYARLKYYF